MPNPNAKQPENVPGRFYVDTNCIDCDVCRDLAENNFTRHDAGGYSYVYKQPQTPQEESLCQEALEVCPVEAIGKNVE
ncbi:MAG TPA: ferredoxin [Blastocatellia bacterium]|nr:ferredoxin [Blastocatellia bacterium]